MKKNSRNVLTSFVRRLSRGALIGALYVILTMVSHVFGLDSGMLPFGIQCRISEALCILPIFAPEAVVGLTVGCFIANLLVGGLWQDVVFGTLATLIGALGALAFRGARGRTRILATVPTVLSNAIIIPFVLRWAYGFGDAWWIFAVTVGAGEVLSATVLGAMLLPVIDRTRVFERSSALDKGGQY